MAVSKTSIYDASSYSTSSGSSEEGAAAAAASAAAASNNHMNPPFARAIPAHAGAPSVAALASDRMDIEPSAPAFEGDDHEHRYQVEPVPAVPEQITVEDMERDRTIAAGVASGVVSLLLLGPIVALIVGFGTAYATQHEGAAGDIARATGDIALAIKERAIEIDNKHRLVDKVKEKVNHAQERLKRADREHSIMDRTKEKIALGCRSTADFVQRHRLLERGMDAIGRALYWLAEKISQKFSSSVEEENTAQRGRRNGQHHAVPTEEPKRQS